MANNYLFTSESVSEGHPDKVADQISDAVLDSILREDPRGRVACETLIKTGVVVVAGEVTTKAFRVSGAAVADKCRQADLEKSPEIAGEYGHQRN